MIAYVLGARRGAGDAEYAGGERPLVVQFVQHTPLLARRCAMGSTGHHQQGYRIGVCLRDRGQDVRETGTRDGECGGRTPAQPRIAIRGETSALFMAHEHMAEPGSRQAAIQFQIVHAGDAEYGVDIIGRKQLDEITASGPRHVQKYPWSAPVLQEAQRGCPMKVVIHEILQTMKFSKLVERISGDGADAWKTHYQASLARERGEDVILLSVGDPDLDTQAPG